MDISQYRSLLTEIYSQQNPAESSKEKLYGSFESLQKVLASQNPAELPIGLQYDIAALPVFSSLESFLELEDFEVYGGWSSFFVQKTVMEVFTAHNCYHCRTGSLQGCLICLSWVAFSGLNLIVASQPISLQSSRFNGFSSAVEGTAGPDGVKLNFQSKTDQPIGCPVNT
jgi:hypothetical protein